MHSNRQRAAIPADHAGLLPYIEQSRQTTPACRYPPFEKDFYEEDAAIAAMNELSVVRAAHIGVPVSIREYP